jgi:hypothetical protein
MARLSAFKATREGIFNDWRTWPTGEGIVADQAWLDIQKANGMLPDVKYRWRSPRKVESSELQGAFTRVWWLDADCRTKHVVCQSLGDNVLMADTQQFREAAGQLQK